MLLAPQPQLSARSYTYSGGLRGIRQTLGVMRAMVESAKCDPVIRQAATTIIFNTPEKNGTAEAGKLFDFVQANVRYVADVWEVETLSTPQKTLQGLIGDCDDQTTLLAALLESVGYQTRFVVAGYSPPRGTLEHVYLQVAIDGEWYDLDPTEKEAFGWAPENPVTIYYEKV